jgi:ABC-2 type transport system ATP-binding protein
VSIAAKNLYKKYGSRFVLEDLSLNVDQGSIYGFLGQNGAGKTTTIKLLSGLSIPTQGQIFIDGMDLSSESEKIKHILGLVPQDSGFYDERTALSHMVYYGRLKGLSKKESLEQSRYLLDHVGLGNEMFKKVGYFSHGMKTRLGVAQALLNNPKIQILDEPTNGLDPVGIRQIRQIFHEFNNKGITIFLSSIISLKYKKFVLMLEFWIKASLSLKVQLKKFVTLNQMGLLQLEFTIYLLK